MKVSVEDPPAVTEAGTNPVVTPAGSPDAVRAIDSALPEMSAVVMLVEPEPPTAAVRAVGLEEIEKSLVGTTTAPVTETLSKPTLLGWQTLCEVTKSPTVAANLMMS